MNQPRDPAHGVADFVIVPVDARTGSETVIPSFLAALSDRIGRCRLMPPWRQVPVRAGMVSKPAEYRWSSYHCNALNEPDRLIQPHPQYLALGRSDTERHEVYRSLFAHELSDERIAGDPKLYPATKSAGEREIPVPNRGHSWAPCAGPTGASAQACSSNGSR